MENLDISKEISISTDRPALIKLPNKQDSFIGKALQWIGVTPKTLDIEVYPTRLATRMRYTEEISCLVKFVNKNKGSNDLSPLQDLNKSDYRALVSGLVCILHNKKTNAPKSLFKAVENLSPKELSVLIDFGHDQLQLENFLSSIILMAKMSLQAGEIIASENSTSGNLKEI